MILHKQSSRYSSILEAGSIGNTNSYRDPDYDHHLWPRLSPQSASPVVVAANGRRRSSVHSLLGSGSPIVLRRSSTYNDRPEEVEDELTQQLSRGLAGGGTSFYTEKESTPLRPTNNDYTRYSSTLDDKHDWGFSTLRRRNSRTGPSHHHHHLAYPLPPQPPSHTRTSQTQDSSAMF